MYVQNYVASGQTTFAGGILTRGDASPAIFAQSVGGGGGIGGASVADGSGGTVNVNVSVGGHGGSGGDGGGVLVDNGHGAILTAGAGSPGIFAQSVGGGGGRGGKASTGSGTDPELAAYSFIATGMGIGGGNQVIANIYNYKDNNPFDPNISGKLFTLLTSYDGSNLVPPPDPLQQPSFASKLTVDVGGSFSGDGGGGGKGGDVTVASAGSIVTQGPASSGIVAQSVGGGGGDGGATYASSNNDLVPGSKLTGAIAVGGGAGSAGGGGQVIVTNAGSIQTSGDASYGIFAHSVGGGGGTGGATLARSSQTISFNVSVGGSGGANGDGGSVTVASPGTIVTYGNAAPGILAQSIGGGGVVTLLTSDAPAGSGGKATSRTGLIPGVVLTPVQLSANGSMGRGSTGGAVSVTLDPGAPVSGDGPRPYVVTNGTDSYAIVAQSVGGGGGLVSGGNNPATGLAGLFPKAGLLQGSGGPVAVTLNNSAYIYTSGAGAVGILAQSVGGGGGLFGGMSQVQLNQVYNGNPNPQSGSGGNVAVSLQAGGNVVTTGSRAHGIFAQSVGGGGVMSQTNGAGFTFASATNDAGCSGAACTGTATVDLGSNTVVRASGSEAYPIFMQSRGNGTSDTVINVGSGGYVESRGQSAAAIYVDGSGTNTINNHGVIDNGTLKGIVTPSGLAIVGASNSAPVTVNNWGLVNGAVALPGSSSFNNLPGAVFRPGDVVDLGSSGRLVNDGTVVVGGSARGGTTLLGDYRQTSAGVLRVNLHAGTGSADALQVNGRAILGGRVEVMLADLANLRPGSRQVNVLNATGGVTIPDGPLTVASRPC